MLVRVLPAWVEPDPLRSRATDALGLQAVADQLAERLLPGLSVLTTRARYFTFLAWARRRTGREHSESNIHRYEVALAFAEASISSSDELHADGCQFVGSRSVKSIQIDRLPSDPRQAYKVPAWRGYRASMVSLGLLSEGPKFALTDFGNKAAGAFDGAVHYRGGPDRPMPREACLSRPSTTEVRLLRELLGLSLRGRLDPGSPDRRVRRALFARELRPSYWQDWVFPETLLPNYERRFDRSLPEPGRTMRSAAVWERLSIGLNTIFTVWVRAIAEDRRRACEKRISELVGCRLAVPPMCPIDVEDSSAALSTGVASLRYALCLHAELLRRGVELPGSDAFDLAKMFISRSESRRVAVQNAIAMMVDRHLRAKGDDAWVREDSPGRIEIARDGSRRWKIPSFVRPHAYRIAAFDRILRDVGGP